MATKFYVFSWPARMYLETKINYSHSSNPWASVIEANWVTAMACSSSVSYKSVADWNYWPGNTILEVSLTTAHGSEICHCLIGLYKALVMFFLSAFLLTVSDNVHQSFLHCEGIPHFPCFHMNHLDDQIHFCTTITWPEAYHYDELDWWHFAIS